ncbi:MAG: tRNA (adenosine(37)-N6)-threonylcarbamoyltransferase complex dimerization subunit type 1 TsaB [Hydrogenophaga sp.]|uniref:tRNA (adenosine(37)-N6)-threonylcarbamoyltransferase complex dimerization subunit type 1 TsaB n=1 Tax=Hydrogenophaga sp. TaxID=1904254 RepID=UPI00262F50C2|nr:tRNA (adenosine(37)-N6)-threonylcarbamoyltransferase complex dimerization subunit type 1 TsaB [Hydrogenophaga sp.]MDM7942973.1 tRNA (adenosine(37)-N6)-threonylcarbamoyltransferase complex dimerization subunit type 1 TsaB [Hydrogenophaga sp.]
MSFSPPHSLRLLALETSTDALSVALGSGEPGAALWQRSGPGGAQASGTLLPMVRGLLDEAGWSLDTLNAVVFGRGPGSFTGLRTACSVAQGLAYGAQGPGRPGGLPVLPVDTLLALAEEARQAQTDAGRPMPQVIVALLDARMGELYVAPYACHAQGAAGLTPLAPPRLCTPADLPAWLQDLPPGERLLTGNVFEIEALNALGGQHLPALPTAAALLRLAPGLLAAGHAVAAQDALPLYVRDKVAQTTAEREGIRLAAEAGT